MSKAWEDLDFVFKFAMRARSAQLPENRRAVTEAYERAYAALPTDKERAVIEAAYAYRNGTTVECDNYSSMMMELGCVLDDKAAALPSPSQGEEHE